MLQTLGNILIRPLPDFDVSTNYSSSPKLNLLDDFAQIFYVLSEMLIPEYLIVDITAGILLLLGADIISSQESGDGEVEGGNAEVRLLKYINMQLCKCWHINIIIRLNPKKFVGEGNKGRQFKSFLYAYH